MNEKQLFSVLIRGIGVIALLEGLGVPWTTFAQWEFFTFREMTLGLVVPNVGWGILAIVLGVSMIRWPGWVVHLAWLERLPTIGRAAGDESK